MFAVVDCDSFFASCEVVFNPKIRGKPVVVLSSNDGCVVARSSEAKKLGIPMGAPAFQYAEIFKKYNVHTFSSNFTLYLDMSDRVMSILRLLAPEVEVYSIDEAFLSLEGLTKLQILDLASCIRATILRWIGIPVSIGIAPTKTLAKVAVEYAKKQSSERITYIEHAEISGFLDTLKIEDVWGIGRRLAPKLKASHIYTAKELAASDDGWIKKKLTVVGLRLAWELRGHSCLDLHEMRDPKKSISTARAFEEPISSYEEIESIVAGDIAYVAEKLRSQRSQASYVSVMIENNRFGPDPYWQNSASQLLPESTSYTPLLINHAKCILRSIFREGIQYKRVGVLLGRFTDSEVFQKDMFEKNSRLQEKHAKVMNVVDAINTKYGKMTIRTLAEGKRNVRKNCISSSFTTRWEALPIVYAKE